MDVSKYGEAPIAPEHDLNTLAAFVEERLDPDERAAVVQHLATCVECREVVAGLAREGIGESRPRTVEERADLHTAQHGLRTGLRAPMWLPIAATIVLVIGAGWFARGRLLAPSPVKEELPVPAPTPSPTPSSANPPAVTPVKPPADPGTTVRTGEREVGGRRFRLEAGTWIDTGYDAFALLPSVDVRTPAERDALLPRLPGLKPFLTLGPKVTVVHQGTVYRFDLPR